MKIRMNNRIIQAVMAAIVIVTGFSACKKDQNTAAPILERVRTLARIDTTFKEIPITLDSNKYANVYTRVANDVTVTGARWNAQYMLVGKNLQTVLSITLNGVSLYFNPALVTDNNVIFTVGADVPYGANQSGKLVVKTKYGTAELDFGLLQPFPVIKTVSPLLGEVGGTVTITGTYFENLKGVKFGTVDAELVGTPTSTEIKVKIPAGIAQAAITVTTAGGSAVSANSFFAFKKLLYQDGWVAGMTSYGGWGGTGVSTPDNTAGGVRGTKSIVINYTANSCPLQFAYTGPTLDLKNFTALKMSIYGGPGTAGKKVKVQLNGNTVYTALLTLTEGSFTDYVIPLSDFPAAVNTAAFSKIWVIEGSGFATSVVYIDEIGLL